MLPGDQPSAQIRPLPQIDSAVPSPSQSPHDTPSPPYYAVVFSSQRTDRDSPGYEAMAARMLELAACQPGYLGVESVRDDEGFGITVSYWESLAAVRAWREQAEHRLAQERGRNEWYQAYKLRICLVENEYGHEQ